MDVAGIDLGCGDMSKELTWNLQYEMKPPLKSAKNQSLETVRMPTIKTPGEPKDLAGSREIPPDE